MGIKQNSITAKSTCHTQDVDDCILIWWLYLNIEFDGKKYGKYVFSIYSAC